MKKYLIIIVSLLLVYNGYAQDDELESKIQNPIASLISIPFQNNMDMGIGEFDRTRNTINIQPVIPFSLSDNLNLITRTIIPIISQPLDENDSQFGLGDINMSFLLTPAKAGKIIYGGGLALGLPTASNAVLGTGKLSMGPTFVALIQPKGWTIGALAQNIWSVSGKAERSEINFFYSQIFITKNLSKGWYINSAPIITANWEADSGNQWTLPLGMGFGRLFRWGKLPINAQAGYYYNVVSPEGAPDSQFRFQVTFLFPK